MSAHTANDANVMVEVVEVCGCLGEFECCNTVGDVQTFVFQHGMLLAGPPAMVAGHETITRRVSRCAFGVPHGR